MADEQILGDRRQIAEHGSVVALVTAEPAQTLEGLLATIDAARRYELEAARNVVDSLKVFARVKKRLVRHSIEGLRKKEGCPEVEMLTLAELTDRHIRTVIASTPSLGVAANVLGMDDSTLYRHRARMNLL